MEKNKTVCEFCHRELDIRDKGIYQRTTGWVMVRSGGGGHGVSLPERESRWAHGICVERVIRGTFNQTMMFS